MDSPDFGLDLPEDPVPVGLLRVLASWVEYYLEFDFELS